MADQTAFQTALDAVAAAGGDPASVQLTGVTEGGGPQHVKFGPANPLEQGGIFGTIANALENSVRGLRGDVGFNAFTNAVAGLPQEMLFQQMTKEQALEIMRRAGVENPELRLERAQAAGAGITMAALAGLGGLAGGQGVRQTGTELAGDIGATVADVAGIKAPTTTFRIPGNELEALNQGLQGVEGLNQEQFLASQQLEGRENIGVGPTNEAALLSPMLAPESGPTLERFNIMANLDNSFKMRAALRGVPPERLIAEIGPNPSALELANFANAELMKQAQQLGVAPDAFGGLINPQAIADHFLNIQKFEAERQQKVGERRNQRLGIAGQLQAAGAGVNTIADFIASSTGSGGGGPKAQADLAIQLLSHQVNELVGAGETIKFTEQGVPVVDHLARASEAEPLVQAIADIESGKIKPEDFGSIEFLNRDLSNFLAASPEPLLGAKGAAATGIPADIDMTNGVGGIQVTRSGPDGKQMVVELDSNRAGALFNAEALLEKELQQMLIESPFNDLDFDNPDTVTSLKPFQRALQAFSADLQRLMTGTLLRDTRVGLATNAPRALPGGTGGRDQGFIDAQLQGLVDKHFANIDLPQAQDFRDKLQFDLEAAFREAIGQFDIDVASGQGETKLDAEMQGLRAVVGDPQSPMGQLRLQVMNFVSSGQAVELGELPTPSEVVEFMLEKGAIAPDFVAQALSQGSATRSFADGGQIASAVDSLFDFSGVEDQGFRLDIMGDNRVGDFANLDAVKGTVGR